LFVLIWLFAAVMTTFFPCVTFGQIAEILDEGQTSKQINTTIYTHLLIVHTNKTHIC